MILSKVPKNRPATKTAMVVESMRSSDLSANPSSGLSRRNRLYCIRGYAGDLSRFVCIRVSIAQARACFAQNCCKVGSARDFVPRNLFLVGRLGSIAAQSPHKDDSFGGTQRVPRPPNPIRCGIANSILLCYECSAARMTSSGALCPVQRSKASAA